MKKIKGYPRSAITITIIVCSIFLTEIESGTSWKYAVRCGGLHDARIKSTSANVKQYVRKREPV